MIRTGSLRTTRALLLGLAILDLVVFGAWIGREVVARKLGTEVRLPVTGFDPRDVLSGHYARFRLVADSEAGAVDPRYDAGAEARSYCLEVRGDGLAHVVRLKTAAEACPLFITPVAHSFGRIDFGVDRFYIDERRRHEVDQIVPGEDTYLRARVFDHGRLHAVDLVVQGRSLGPR